MESAKLNHNAWAVCLAIRHRHSKGSNRLESLQPFLEPSWENCAWLNFLCIEGELLLFSTARLKLNILWQTWHTVIQNSIQMNCLRLVTFVALFGPQSLGAPDSLYPNISNTPTYSRHVYIYNSHHGDMFQIARQQLHHFAQLVDSPWITMIYLESFSIAPRNPSPHHPSI